MQTKALCSCLFFLITLTLSQGISATNKNSETRPLSDKALKKIQGKLSQNAAMEVHFKKKVYRNLRKKTTIKTGWSYMLRSGQFVWKLTEPQEETLVFKGRTT